MKDLKELNSMYSLSKTLRFELRPIGKTLEHIEQKGLIEQDEQRATEYAEVKTFIDRYHKAFIAMCMKKCQLKLTDTGNLDSLEEYETLLSKSQRNKKDEENLSTIKNNLRKQIVASFVKGGSYNDLFNKELIEKHLPEFLTDEEERRLVEHFHKFTTYFTGFHENRKNMYSDEEKSTAIAHRLIDENFPLFHDNMRSFKNIANSEVANHFLEIEKAYKQHLNVEHIGDMFQLNYFSNTLTQEQIEVYNNVIGGKTENDGTKIQGLNEYINLYNQVHRDNRLPFLKPLYKMILSDRVALSWLPEEFDSDEAMLHAINHLYESLQNLLWEEGESSLRHLLLHISRFNTEQIYLSNDETLTNISQRMFGQYNVFSQAVKDDLRNKYPKKPKAKQEAYDEEIEQLFKSKKSFSISYLNSLIDGKMTIEDYFKQLGAYDRDGEQRINHFAQIQNAHTAVQSILYGNHTDISQSENDIKLIKDLMDSFKGLQHFIKPLLGSGEEAEKDNEFYFLLRNIWDELNQVTPLYNMVRNRLTRKPYSIEKIKLNFENAQLLGGWDLNKEPDCTSILLRDENNFFLAIMDKKHNRAFEIDQLPCDGDCYLKVDYKLLPGANKMLPKVFFSKSRIHEFNPSEEIQNKYKKGTHKQGNNFSLTDCHKLIDFFKQSIQKHEDWNKFPFTFSDTSSYQSITEFYQEVEHQGYMLGFRKVSKEFINKLVDEGKLYLFQIWNKDFSQFSKGTPNMHTLYWKILFDPENLTNVVYKLNGKAEVFYRKGSIDMQKNTIHKAHQPIPNKNVQNTKSSSTFDYDIIKNRRYTVDKFQFHVPITINFKSVDKININKDVLEIIRNNGIEHIIGIDRGERHLLYLSLIDLQGNIIQQMTLNEIKQDREETFPTNYKDILSAREGERNEARRNWKKIDNIKNLKSGYLSQAVHVITKMMVEYNAIVVLEDLNMGFIRGRQKIERSIYEQFERMLIEKLNFLVDKKTEAHQSGGILKGLQLTNKFESFKKLGKQCGCLFYVPAWNTSKIDPVTGFVSMLDTRYENKDKAKAFFGKFDSIRYNKEKDWFEFTFDYNQFHKKLEGTKTKWTLCTYGTRVRTFRNSAKLNHWDNEEINLTTEFKNCFAEAGIDIHGNLKDAICSLNDKKPLEELMGLMKLLLQLRNSITNSEVDYLLSPVAADGTFYDSRTCGNHLPVDADANGAFNIARKGLMLVQRIQSCQPNNQPDLKISNKDWLLFVQNE